MKAPDMSVPGYRRGLITTAIAVPSRHTEITDREQSRALWLVIMMPGALSTAGFGTALLLLGASVAGLILVAHALLMACCVLAMFLTRRVDDVIMVGFSVVHSIVPFVVSLSMGGIIASGAIAIWGFLPLMFMLVAYGRRVAFRFFAGFVALLAADVVVAVVGVVPPVLSVRASASLLGFNFVVVLGYIVIGLAYFVYQRDTAYGLLAVEQDRSERLLLNVLPAPIATRLKETTGTIADHYDEASVLFADVAGFTPLSQTMEPSELVEMLNEVFTVFDGLVDARGLEKIKTIGDSYMVAAGVPAPRSDHASVLCDLALAMLAEVKSRPFRGHQLVFRIGINSGPVVAGVIGARKFIYDLWGDTVNTASRMEGYGVAGEIQVTEATCALVEATFDVEPRGPVAVKGKGLMPVYLIRGRRDTESTGQAHAARISPS